MHSVEAVLWMFNFDLFLSYQYLALLWCWAEADSRSSQSADIHLQPSCAHTAVPFFTFSTVFNKWHELFSQFSWSAVSNSLRPHGRTPGFSVHHQLLKLAQTHVHPVSDAIQSSHPLSSPSPPAFNLSQHQALFQLVSSSNQVAKVLELQLHNQSFKWIFRTDSL